jgi:glycosyltransferase involved in cell wall biosynthesis
LSNIPPTISVLLPVFNTARYVRAAVQSILVQTFPDFELLALDDGSTDNSLSILREFEASDCRLRVLSRENRGVAPTRNELISMSRGRYLAKMDSDDISRPQRFEKQVVYLDAHPECVAVGTGALFIDPEGMPIREFMYESMHDEIDAAHLFGASGSRMCHPSVMMRRDAVVQVGKYREEYRFSEDMDLFLRLAEIGQLANLSDILFEYRQHLRSIGYAHRIEELKFAKQAVRAARTRRGIAAIPKVIESPMEPEAAADTHRKWAWWALSAGNLVTARKHAIIALVKQPLNIENLRVVACAIRGY